MNLKSLEIKFTSFLSLSSFLKPARLTESAWIQHVPFAFWVTEQLKPKVLVELGVHTGLSYFSFCQSVKVNNLSTLCYGIDTWKGDEHAGVYSEEIWLDVQNYNTCEYASFSYLLKNTFDEALKYFEDKTIDLLHIDGYHSYEAVTDDFQKWLPKISDNAIVLFHDTVVRERDFGVYKFWRELKEKYQSFEFIHGHGLGVLAIGTSYSTALHELFELVDENQINKIRSVYAYLGTRFSENFATITLNNQFSDLSAQNQILNEQGVHLKAEYESLNAQHEQLKIEHTLLDQLQNLQQQLENAQTELQQSKTENDLLQQAVDSAKSQNNDLKDELQQFKNVHDELCIKYDSTIQELVQLQKHYVLLNETLQKVQEQLENKTAQEKQLKNQLLNSKEEYQKLKSQYEVLEKLIAEAKNKQSMLQDQKEEYHLLQKKSDVAVNELNIQLADVKRVLAETQSHNSQLNIDLARQQQIIQWYKRTYQDRGLLGTIKEKLRSKQKK